MFRLEIFKKKFERLTFLLASVTFQAALSSPSGCDLMSLHPKQHNASLYKRVLVSNALAQTFADDIMALLIFLCFPNPANLIFEAKKNKTSF